MGEQAEAMLDGTCCQECGGYIPSPRAPGHPRTCVDCQRGTADERVDRRRDASDQFLEAAGRAHEKGLELIQHRAKLFSEPPQRYTLCGSDWRLAVYPGNCRLWSPQPNGRHPKRAPYFGIPAPWTLLDVVNAAPAAAGSTGD